MTRIGFKPTLIAGLLFIAAGLLWFSQVSPGGSYVGDVLFPSHARRDRPGLRLRVGHDRGGDRHEAQDEAGLASGLINTSQQVGGALGLAITATVANATTSDVFAAGERNQAVALTQGFQDAFLVCAGLALLGASWRPR